MTDLVCIRTYLNKHEAQLAKGCLESAGIEAMVMVDDGGGSRPELTFGSGARLFVKQSNQKKAHELLGNQT